MFGEQEIIGRSIGNLDSKKRIIVPSYTKAEHNDKIIIKKTSFRGEEALKLYAADKYIEIIKRYQKLRDNSNNIDEYERYTSIIEDMYFNLDYCKELDKQRKLLIPIFLIKELGWEEVDTVLLNGLGDSLLVRKQNK